jgi:SAM-dependent methyltransferase
MKSISCEVCGSNQHRFLFKGWDRVFGIPGFFTLVQCKDCGLIFVNPQPDEKVLMEYYPKAYYVTKPFHYRKYSWIRQMVMEEYFGYGRRLNSSKGLHLFRKMALLPFRVRYRSSIPFIEKGRLLDIGCHNGTALYKLKAMGWKAYGVEVDEGASAQARSKGLDVFTGDLFEANYPDQFFHVVRMSFVLEHLPNPRNTLLEIKRILKPQGRIYISIQNARSLHYWLFRNHWFSLDVPRHLFSFSPKTIRKLFSSLDMEIKTIRFDSGTRSFLASLQYWMNERYRRGAWVQRNQPIAGSHLLKRLFRPFCWVVDRLELGDLIHLEVVKP